MFGASWTELGVVVFLVAFVWLSTKVRRIGDALGTLLERRTRSPGDDPPRKPRLP